MSGGRIGRACHISPGIQDSGDNRTADQRVAALARRRHGIVTRAELLAAGLTRDGISRRCRACRLHRVWAGVYFVGAAPLPPRARWLAAVLTCGPGAALSHQSAAALWGIGPLLVLPVHVTIPSPCNRRSRPGLRVHRSSTLGPADVTTRDGIPVTAPSRTLRDLPAPLRDRATNAALIGGLVGAPPGRRPLRSNAERRFLRLCRAHGLPEPEVNVVIAGRERDFAWRESAVVVEVDGPHHDHEPQRAVDRGRDRELAARGWVVLRYGVGELARAGDSLVAELGALLRARR